MSSSLHWRPVPPPMPESELSSDLKFKIREFFEGGMHGGEPGYNEAYSITNGDLSFLGFLTGLKACGIEDADLLLKMIGKHKVIEIWIGDGDGPR